MDIQKATKEDFEEYSKLKEDDFKEYGKLINIKLVYSKPESKKEFFRILNSKEDFLFFAKESDNIKGFIHGTIKGKSSSKKANIEYLFIEKKSRGKGIAKILINHFMKLIKSKKCKSVFLKVNTKNVNALKLYHKLGFEITNYIMRMKVG